MLSEDMLRNEILSMLREGNNLPSEEVDTLPNTSIKVKKGRIEEFKNRARNYFELVNNHILTDAELESIDYVGEAINLAHDESLRINGEIYRSEIAELFNANSKNVEEINKLNAEFDSINRRYNELIKESAELSTKYAEDHMTLQKKLEPINVELVKIGSRKPHLIASLIAKRKEVNSNFVKMVQYAMAELERNYTETPKTVEPFWTPNGVAILPSDKEKYEDLIELLRIVNSVNNEEKLVTVNGLVCVNESQETKLKEIFSRGEVFNQVNVKAKNEAEIANERMINTILSALARMRENGSKLTKGYKQLRISNGIIVSSSKKGSEDLSDVKIIRLAEEDIEEYKVLYEMLQILNRSRNSDLPLFPIWNIAHIQYTEKDKFENLIAKSKLFQNRKPEAKPKKEENLELITKIEEQLDELAGEISNNSGFYSVSSRKVETLDGKSWIIPSEFYDEAVDLVAAIDCLKFNKTGYKLSIFNLGYIDPLKIEEFKRLVRRNKFLNDMVPDLPENISEIDKIKERLAELIKKAKDNPDKPLAPNGHVLAEDEEEYNKLEEQYKLLRDARFADDVEKIEGVTVPSSGASSYRKTAGIGTGGGAGSGSSGTTGSGTTNPTINEDKIKQLVSLAATKKLPTEASAIIKELYDILNEAQKSEHLVEVEPNVFVDESKKDRYLELSEKLKELSQELPPPVLDPKLNDPIINILKVRISELVKDAINEIEENVTYVDRDYRVKHSDALNCNLLILLTEILTRAKSSTNLKEVAPGIKVDASEEELWRNVSGKVRKMNPGIFDNAASLVNVTENVVTENVPSVMTIKKRIAEILKNAEGVREKKLSETIDGKVRTTDLPEYNLLKELENILSHAKDVKDLTDGLKISDSDKSRYEAIKTQLNNINAKKAEEEKKQKTGIRKLINKVKWWDKNRDKVAKVGLRESLRLRREYRKTRKLHEVGKIERLSNWLSSVKFTLSNRKEISANKKEITANKKAMATSEMQEKIVKNSEEIKASLGDDAENIISTIDSSSPIYIPNDTELNDMMTQYIGEPVMASDISTKSYDEMSVEELHNEINRYKNILNNDDLQYSESQKEKISAVIADLEKYLAKKGWNPRITLTPASPSPEPNPEEEKKKLTIAFLQNYGMYAKEIVTNNSEEELREIEKSLNKIIDLCKQKNIELQVSGEMSKLYTLYQNIIKAYSILNNPDITNEDRASMEEAKDKILQEIYEKEPLVFSGGIELPFGQARKQTEGEKSPNPLAGENIITGDGSSDPFENDDSENLAPSQVPGGAGATPQSSESLMGTNSNNNNNQFGLTPEQIAALNAAMAGNPKPSQVPGGTGTTPPIEATPPYSGSSLSLEEDDPFAEDQHQETMDKLNAELIEIINRLNDPNISADEKAALEELRDQNLNEQASLQGNGPRFSKY